MSTDAFTAVLRDAGVVPVITIADAGRAIPLARTLVEAGLPVIEVTLRTDAALEALRLMSAEVPGAVVGAGTVRSLADIEAATAAGARFLVSPGTTPELAGFACDAALPFLPGCATPSEAMALAELGFETLKFFPASAYGGEATLKALAGPLPDLSFVPTGGVGPANLEAYLKLPNVVAVGGSWMVRPEWIAAGDDTAIREAARAASDAVRAVHRQAAAPP